MSKRGKGKNDDDFIDDSDDDTVKRPKKTIKRKDSGDKSDDGEDLLVFEVSNNRKCSVRNWKGKVWIDIREYYEKDGKQLPGRKGISLSTDQWKQLREHAPEIDKVVDAQGQV